MDGTFAGWLQQMLDEKREEGYDPKFMLSPEEYARLHAECGMLERVIKKYWEYEQVTINVNINNPDKNMAKEVERIMGDVFKWS